MGYKLHKENLIPTYPSFNSDISFPSILALATAMAALFFSDALLSYTTQNPENFIIYLLIRLLLFILVPITFLLGTTLLIIRAAVPSNSPLGEIYAIQVNRMTAVTVNLALVCLLAEVAIGVYLVLPEAVAAWWFVR